MGKIFISCPECHTGLSINEIPGYQNMIIECPACHFKSQVCEFQGKSQARGGQGADDMPTQLVMPGQSTLDVGQIRVKSTNEVVMLKPGSNVIGRRAQTGTADIKISTDMYMSRRHVIIEVVKKPSGYEHRLVEINSKNIVKLNGKPINRGEILILKFGDTLTLGTTDIVLESNSDDATRVL